MGNAVPVIMSVTMRYEYGNCCCNCVVKRLVNFIGVSAVLRRPSYLKSIISAPAHSLALKRNVAALNF